MLVYSVKKDFWYPASSDFFFSGMDFSIYEGLWSRSTRLCYSRGWLIQLRKQANYSSVSDANKLQERNLC